MAGDSGAAATSFSDAGGNDHIKAALRERPCSIEHYVNENQPSGPQL